MEKPKRTLEEKLLGEYRNVCLFIDIAKTHIQLATGALLLSVTFSKGLTGDSGNPFKELSLLIPWLCWLMTILIGAIYQYCAAKFLQNLEWKNGTQTEERDKSLPIFDKFVERPWKLYVVFLSFFYGGIIWFAIAAVYQLVKYG